MNRDNEAELPEAMLAEAASWHVRSEDERPDAMDWDAFTDWLEADPRHRHAFDQMALTADAIDRHKTELGVADADEDDDVSPQRGRGALWRWGGLAIAASLAAIVAAPQFLVPAPAVYATQAGSSRIALADGSSVLLAPHSRLTVAGRAQDHMDITGGAIFDIRHDPSRTLTISAGGVSISDIGTRFDVQQQDEAVRVSIAEGRVRVSGQALAQPIALAAGSGLTFDANAGTAIVAPVKAADVGAWQDGRLSYDNAPLALVATDLRRYAGVRVNVPAPLRSRRFSGTLIVDDGEKALRDLVQLMDLRLGGHAGAWRLEQR
ncbi:FecR family protein [Novosphingobium colocasiae]|uniref:Sensor n=1 Tax=Novosphingobium colocasiae TaxID=1256513 RepID=A0A918UET3_9SPHN|nr:FecR domain-containing protein [Novosphingobium colocasiae]GGY97766.1 sensor [Novosphingobium colocasiae]